MADLISRYDESVVIKAVVSKEMYRRIQELCGNYKMSVSDLIRYSLMNEYDSFKGTDHANEIGDE